VRRLGVVLIGVALLAAGCKSPSPEQRALDQAESHLDQVRSGRLALTFLASDPKDGSDNGLGFALRGPFSVAVKKGSLPVADLAYTRVTGSHRRTTKFITTGTHAFVEVDGKAYRLPDDQLADLRSKGEDGGGLEGLALDDWIDEPRVAKAGTLEGTAVDRITGTVDVIKAINGMVSLTHSFGAASGDAPKPLEGDGAKRVERAVRTATVKVVVGHRDHLVRHFELVLLLDPRQQVGLESALGRFASVRMRFALDVFGVNRPVHVAAPARSRPVSELDQSDAS
jgi:hypothetical protein